MVRWKLKTIDAKIRTNIETTLIQFGSQFIFVFQKFCCVRLGFIYFGIAVWNRNTPKIKPMYVCGLTLKNHQFSTFPKTFIELFHANSSFQFYEMHVLTLQFQLNGCVLLEICNKYNFREVHMKRTCAGVSALLCLCHHICCVFSENLWTDFDWLHKILNE